MNFVAHNGRKRVTDIDSLDHLVLTVKDIDATCEFYSKVLGMKGVTFGGGRTALSFGTAFPGAFPGTVYSN